MKNKDTYIQGESKTSLISSAWCKVVQIFGSDRRINLQVLLQIYKNDHIDRKNTRLLKKLSATKRFSYFYFEINKLFYLGIKKLQHTNIIFGVNINNKHYKEHI